MKKTKFNAAYQIKANPPHLGNILEIMYAMERFNKIYIVVYDKPTLLSTDQCIEMLNAIFMKVDKDKFMFARSTIDFEHMNELPKELIDNDVTHIITASDKVYANLKSKGFPYIIRVPHPSGFYDDYQQIAYGRGYLLDRVKSKFCFE